MQARSTFNIKRATITIFCVAVIGAEVNAATFSQANHTDAAAAVERPHPTPRPRPSPHARPLTIIVTNTNDSGPGSLRQALANARDGFTIMFSITGTIGLTSGELLVENNIEISGPGSDVLFIDSNAKSRVFHILPNKNVTISHLAIRNGKASGVFPDDSGAGIYIDHATAVIDDCTMTGNSADGSGGAIYNNGAAGSAALLVSNTTINTNSANQVGNGDGGGIFSDGQNQGTATMMIANSTFSENSAGWKGGALFNDGQQFGSATVELGNTVLNAGVSGANISNAEGTVTSLGYNLSSDDGSSYLAGPGDQINTDPVLGPLQTNGGPTSTHALLSGSPAIDAGDPAFTPPPSDDQRGAGFDRVVNGRIDIGSFEVQVPMIDSSF